MKNLAGIALAALLIACSSSDPETLVKDGGTALGSGDSKTAQTKFSEALEELKPGDALYIDAKIGLVEALIASDPKKATAEFLALADQSKEKVTEKEFLHIGSQMVSSRKYLDAIDLLHFGIKRAGGSSPVLLAQIDRIKKEAASSDSAVSDKLKSLGYLQ